jgi:tRNA threonylcarbamoyladenosine biosynthesis protein TsaE
LRIIVDNESELLPAARQLLGAYPGSRIFAIYGKMGAGKTTFIKALCQDLGVDDIVQSPTFALVNVYKTREGRPVYHFDFYRISRTDEVLDIGYEEYLFSGEYCFIEWPELIGSLLPSDTVRISISGETRRIIEGM